MSWENWANGSSWIATPVHCRHNESDLGERKKKVMTIKCCYCLWVSHVLPVCMQVTSSASEKHTCVEQLHYKCDSVINEWVWMCVHEWMNEWFVDIWCYGKCAGKACFMIDSWHLWGHTPQYTFALCSQISRSIQRNIHDIKCTHQIHQLI